MERKLIVFTLLIIASVRGEIKSQEKSLPECIDIALQNNLQLRVAELDIQRAKTEQTTAFNPEKTSVTYEQDPLTPDWIDKKLTVSQTMEFPTVYIYRKKMLAHETRLVENAAQAFRNELVRDVSVAYYAIFQARQKMHLLQQQDSLYAGCLQTSASRLRVGETNSLEMMNVLSRRQENRLQLQEATVELENAQLTLMQLLNTSSVIRPTKGESGKIPEVFPETTDSVAIRENPSLAYYAQQMNVLDMQTSVEKSKLLPDLFVAYTFGDMAHPGFQVGVSVPLFFGTQRARIKSAEIQHTQAGVKKRQAEQALQQAYHRQRVEYCTAKENLTYYETEGLAQADEMLKIASATYQTGEIDYMEYVQHLQAVIDVRLRHIEALSRYNKSVIQLKYLRGIN
ncbi:MAG: TolC family protein [Bacteroidales bacterium]|jgi:cobalt-zinc-cadmium resistance protein CzcA|nr:TolC family protein [Bacteroidales bacterium]